MAVIYDIEYLPIAREDMIDIAVYIDKELKNPEAAQRLMNKFIDSAEKRRAFPHAAKVYQPIRPLKKEYRKIIVNNYIMFYWIDEEKKKIVVARVLYGKRDYADML